MLLDQLRDSPSADAVNWTAVESLISCGGIRIEDNIVITDQAPENMTRDAFDALSSASA